MATDTPLTGSTQPIPLAIGYTLLAPGLQGEVRKIEPAATATRGAAGIRPDDQPFASALQRAGARLSAEFEFTITGDDHGSGTGTATRGGQVRQMTDQGEPAMEFAAPQPGANARSIVLYTDESGESRWIWPRRTDGEKAYFYLPRESDSPPAAATNTRGAIIAGMRRIVKVITWATDEIVGDLALDFAQKWEEKNRAYGFHYVQPNQFGGEVPWGRLAEGRTLLLLHGTFSNGQGAFDGLIRSDWMRKMADYYGGRIIAFNHPSLHHSPEDNIREFRRMLPPEVKNLEFDLVTHSRGGLVGRELCERFAPEGQDKRVRVNRAVFVAGPHSGTILTDRENWSTMIDSYTNLLVGLPDNALTITLEGLFTLIKVVGGGVVHGLPGLQSMLPGGEYVKTLNTAPQSGGSYYALAAQYMPADEHTAGGLGKKVLIKALRKIFGEDSDLVVPTKGCYSMQPEVAGFAIPEKRYKVYGVEEDTHHLNFFEKEAVNKQLHDWLTAPG